MPSSPAPECLAILRKSQDSTQRMTEGRGSGEPRIGPRDKEDPTASVTAEARGHVPCVTAVATQCTPHQMSCLPSPDGARPGVPESLPVTGKVVHTRPPLLEQALCPTRS